MLSLLYSTSIALVIEALPVGQPGRQQLHHLLTVWRGRGVALLRNQLLQILDRGRREGRLGHQQAKQNSDETLHLYCKVENFAREYSKPRCKIFNP